MFLDIFAEEGGVGEAEYITDLLDAVVGLLQIIADVLNHMFCNPFVGGFSRMFLEKHREVFGRDAEFFGIPFHLSVFHLCGMQ